MEREGRSRSGLFRILDHVSASVHPLSRAGDGFPGDGVQPPALLLGGVRAPADSWPGSRTICRPLSRHGGQDCSTSHAAAHAMKGGDDGEEDDGDDDDKSRALLG